MKSLSLLLLLSCLHLSGESPKANPHPVPKLDDLYKPWGFARASEASTLFIEPHYEGKEPYGHLIKTENSLQWFEFDGERSTLWEVERFEEAEKELRLFLKGGNKVLIFPYWDIDQCLLIIRFSPESEENPTRFSVPYSSLLTIPYLEGEE